MGLIGKGKWRLKREKVKIKGVNKFKRKGNRE